MVVPSNPAPTATEMMIAAAAREIRDSELVFVGMRLPLLAFMLAKATHAPNAVGLFESGVLRAIPAPAPLFTMCDLPNLYKAVACTEMQDVMALLQAGHVTLGRSHIVKRGAGAGVARSTPDSKRPTALGAWVSLASWKASSGKRIPTKTTSPSRISREAATTISSGMV